jgi:hypothetical protein
MDYYIGAIIYIAIGSVIAFGFLIQGRRAAKRDA